MYLNDVAEHQWWQGIAEPVRERIAGSLAPPKGRGELHARRGGGVRAAEVHEAAIHRHGVAGGAEQRHRIISRGGRSRRVVRLAVGRVVRRPRRVRLEGPRPRVAVVWEHVRRARFGRDVLQ